MPWKREPVSVKLVPVIKGEVTVAICGCQSGLTNLSQHRTVPRCGSIESLSIPPATSTCRWAVRSPCEHGVRC